MLYRFGVFEFDADSGELRKNGRAVSLEPQPARALSLLLARAGDVVSREEIRDAVWGRDTHVDFDRGLAYCISQVRAALGDSADTPRFVQTLPKRGFKFIASVAQTPPAHAESVVAADPTANGASGVTDISTTMPRQRGTWPAVAAFAVALVAALTLFWMLVDRSAANEPAVIAVSVFDNETGHVEYDRQISNLSDLVVERLTKIDPNRILVVGNAAILRQPRNIRNLKAVAAEVKADYVLLGQLQRGEAGLQFITHFIRLRDEAHLRANRLPVSDPNLAGLESAVIAEFERAAREHILNRDSN